MWLIYLLNVKAGGTVYSLSLSLSMTLAAQSRAMASSFLRFFEITHQSVGLLWTSDQLFAETST